MKSIFLPKKMFFCFRKKDLELFWQTKNKEIGKFVFAKICCSHQNKTNRSNDATLEKPLIFLFLLDPQRIIFGNHLFKKFTK